MKTLRDTWIVFARHMQRNLHSPIWLVIGVSQPILYLVLFGPLLEPIAKNLPAFQGANAYQVLVPGLLIQLGIFGAMGAGFGLIGEKRSGHLEMQRVSPASRTALLLGRVLSNVFTMLAQSIILVLVGLFFGLRVGFWDLLLALLVVALLGASFAAISYAISLGLKDESGLATLLNGINVPLLLLSGILLPMTLAPLWLRTLSDINPLKHILDGVRDVFKGDPGSANSLWALGITLALFALTTWLGTWRFRKAAA